MYTVYKTKTFQFGDKRRQKQKEIKKNNTKLYNE